jgi:hypothetical protein
MRKAGYGFIEGRRFDEKSLLVVGKKGEDGGALLGHLKHLGEKYGQESILHKPHNSEKASLQLTIPKNTNTSKLVLGTPIEFRNSIR